MKYCPCGSQNRYLDCCGQYLQKRGFAETPEALMRSRYTAYVEGNLDYIRKTMREPALLNFKQKVAKRDKVQWLGLEVLSSGLDPNNEAIGFVEFKAKYQDLNSVQHLIHENSEFHFIEGRWYYVDGTFSC